MSDGFLGYIHTGMVVDRINTGLIVAAGTGERFGGPPKQFIELLDKPLIIHTIERFESCTAIDEIVLVVASDQLDFANRLVGRYSFAKIRAVVAGGSTRAVSVKNGLNEIDKENAWIVAVHDGARPLVFVDEITRTVEAASLHGAACLVADVTDTIKEVDKGFITGTVPRANLRRALTPQAFQYDILTMATDSVPEWEDATDECSIVEKAGIRVFCVEGSPRNIKVTKPEDLILVKMYLESGGRSPLVD